MTIIGQHDVLIVIKEIVILTCNRPKQRFSTGQRPT